MLSPHEYETLHARQKRSMITEPKLSRLKIQTPTPGRDGQRSWPAAIALHGPATGALTGLRTDQRGCLGLHGLLELYLVRRTGHIHAIKGVQRIKKFKQGRLREGHLVLRFRRVPWSVVANPHTVPPRKNFRTQARISTARRIVTQFFRLWHQTQ